MLSLGLRNSVVLAAAALISTIASPAAAQLDATGLIGYAVTTVDDRFDDVNAAATRFRNGDVTGARALLDGVGMRFAELPPTDITIAKMCFATGQEGLGRSALDAATIAAPNDPEAYVLMGEMDLQQGRVTAAELQLAKGLELAGSLQNSAKRQRAMITRAANNLAGIAERREDWTTAQTNLNLWLQEAPSEVSALRRLGRAQFMLKAYPEAHATLTKAHELDPNQPGPDATMGRLYSQNDDETRAKQLMDRAKQVDAGNIGTQLTIAQWLLDTGQLDQAAATLVDAQQIDENSIDVLLLRGVVERLKNNLPEAEKNLETAHLLDPVNFNAINQLALVLINQNDMDKRERAGKYAEMNARNYPQNSEAGVTLAWVYYQSNRSAEAQRVLSGALQSGGLNADSSYLVAEMLAATGRKAEAARLLESAIATKQLFIQRGPAEALLNRIRSEPGGG